MLPVSVINLWLCLKCFQLELRDRNETLHQKLEKLQGKFGTLATTKADISSQLLMTEEEKLKVRAGSEQGFKPRVKKLDT